VKSFVRFPLWWITGFALVALAGIAVDAAQAPRVIPLPEAIAAYTPPVVPERPIQSAVVLQKSDCNGNLRMLDLLHRRHVRDRVRLSVIWYAGPPADSTYLRAALPRWTRPLPLRPLPRAVLAELKRFGHESTPILIVLDQHGRIRLTSQSPRSPREFAGLTRIVEGLTWIEEL
jgi:hypothetical protein